MLEWDEAKRASNVVKHGVDFARAAAFEWDTALVRADTRSMYGEVRLVAMGLIKDRVHVLVFTIRETGIRVISLRKANSKEVGAYVLAVGES